MRPQAEQLLLEVSPPQQSNLPGAFKRLYYHLYTNSSASRAERIVEDLSLLLLLKLASEKSDETHAALRRYQSRADASSKPLLAHLHRQFPTLVDRRKTFSLGGDALRTALADLDRVQLAAAPAHVLGEAFQALMGPRLRGDKGQFFTPRTLVRAMVRIIDPAPDESILDPACGTGGFLAEAHVHQAARNRGKPCSGRLVGVDKDHDLYRLASALLQIATAGRATAYNFSSLDEEQWRKAIEEVDDHLFDVVLTNPPFGTKIALTDANVLRQFDLGHHWLESAAGDRWELTGGVAASQDPQVLFLELCVRHLRPGGRLGIVLPEGVFGNRNLGYVWDWLRSKGTIVALLDCPRTTFQPGTDTKTNVLFFRRAAEGDRVLPSPARIGVALTCGHDRRGRSENAAGEAYPDDFERLSIAYHAPRSPGWLAVVPHNPYYLVPRYYSVEEPLSPQEKALCEGARIVTIGELVADGVLSIRKGNEVGSEVYGTGDVPFVRTSDIFNFEISSDPTKCVSEEVYETFAAQQRLKPGDLLVVVDGRYRIGSTAMLTERNYRCVVQSHLRIVSVRRPEVLDPYDLLFALALPSVRLRIRDLVFVQSTLGTLGKRFLELRVPIFHGAGPWAERIVAFRDALQRRDRLLDELRNVSGPDYEL